jgi:site-specific recombinase XerD
MTQVIKIKNHSSLQIYKRIDSKYWWVSFYVNAKSYSKNGLHRQSLKLTNQREAERKAKEIYKNFDFSIITKKNSQISLRKDIFEPFMQHKLRRQKFKDNGYNAQREEQQFTKYIEPYQTEVDYRDVSSVEENTDEMIQEMKDSGIKDVTIVKYISLLSQMFRYAKDRGFISQVPTFPVLTRIVGNQRLAYEPKEKKLILQRCEQEFKKTEDKFFDEMCDYLSWIDIDGWRQGLEPMNIKHFQVKFCKFQNFTQRILRINIKKTKTGRENWLEAYPQFVDYNWPRITNRYPNFTAENYVFFPSEEKRLRIWDRVRKNFRRFSIELGLYMKENKPRPMTSYRHASAQRMLLKGSSLDDVAMKMNTSKEMIQRVYAHSSNEHFALQKHIERYKGYYTREEKKKA